MKYKLKDLVEIISGFQLREKLEKTNIGAYRIILPKDIDRDMHEVDLANLYLTDIRNPEKYFVRKGDVLLQARGFSYPPSLIRVDLDRTAVSSQYYIIRANPDRILPEFLAFYLSLEPVQKRLKGLARGTNIMMLVKDELEKFILDVPHLGKQKYIVELSELAKKEKKLMEELIYRRNMLLSALCEDEK
ncbi:MAG TPA: hypothetical protein DET40_00340 [Lentisphaeria bacterium]|nr:MAG: hypothetical protein A2X45_10745 [Lentisphaerae bacterium GWF2_50_93]HCE41981.1 hypothetical protein [Lentisphaeria bacterium]